MKKRAFTLTELLVVVVIIGVLSAVVLPKFTKVLQTRKTTEAENVMAAVRNEQEARCMVGRNYTADTAKLAALPKATSKNYTYSLGAQGITATAKDGNYTLQIPSYTDGRICCSGDGCDGLNKDYPKCGAIPNLEEATCEAPDLPGEQEQEEEEYPECAVPSQTTETKTESCGCTSSGTKTATRTFDEVSCAWSDWTWGSCSEKETECCSPSERDLDECAHDGGTWNYDPAVCKCDIPERSCDTSHQEGPTQEPCDCGSYKTVTWHCGADTDYQWKSKTDWTNCRDEQHEQEDCEHEYGTWNHDTCTCAPKVCSYTEDECHDEHGIWHNDCCVCTGGGIEEYDRCEYYGGTFNWSTCSCDINCKESDINACQDAGGNFNYNTCVCKCPGNTTMVNGKCVCNAAASTKSSCTNSGGTWDDASCTCKNASSSCSWVVTSDETDIPTGYSCGQIKDGETCGDNPELWSGKHSAFETRPACTRSTKGRTFNYCTLYDVCPGGGIRMDQTIYECKCS